MASIIVCALLLLSVDYYYYCMAEQVSILSRATLTAYIRSIFHKS